MPDVLFVQMPYAAVHHPSIALGLLKRAVREHGPSAEIVHANLDWAEVVGLDVYLAVYSTETDELVAEWTFGGAAFPGFPADVRTLGQVAPRSFAHLSGCLRSFHPTLDVERLLILVRDRARVFVDRLAERVAASGARVVGCSSIFQQHCASLALLRRVRELAPDVVTLLGGGNCEGPMGAATHRAFPWVDYVATGEADAWIGPFCAALLDHGRALPDRLVPATVLGPGDREAQARRAADDGHLARLDDAQVPDYDDYFRALSRSTLAPHVRPGLLMEGSRGCWWADRRPCTFCALNGSPRPYRGKSVDRVVREMDTLAERHGIDRIAMVDNVLDRATSRALTAALSARARRREIFWEVRPTLRREDVEQLAAAGVRWLQPGLENLHDGVLRLMGKGTTALQNVAVLKWARRSGVRLAWGFLVGTPGEQDAWYQELARWLPWISHLPPPVGTAEVRFHRFSRYVADAARYGLSLAPARAYAHVYPLPAEELSELAYFFEARRPVDGGPGEGQRRVLSQLCAWRAQHAGAVREPVLTQRWRDGALLLLDTRPVAVEREQLLEGAEARVYAACSSPARVSGLRRALRDGGTDVAGRDLERLLAGLEARRLLLRAGDAVVALAVPTPIAPPPDERDAPEGFISMADVLRSHAEHSLARAASRPAWDRPALEAFGALTSPPPRP